MSQGRYRAYPKYKDSGEAWIGEIPAGWNVLRGKYIFWEVSERSVHGEETLLSVSEYYGVKPRGEVIEEGEFLSRAESLEGYKKCQVDDLVMNIMLAWKRGLGVSKFNGIVSPAYSVFRFFGDVHPDYMHHLLRTDLYTGHFKTRSTGVIDSRLRLYPESFFDTAILLPPLPEQTQIAKFLDHETAKIERLIEKQAELIRLLKEKRQAVISHAVTKGLNPHAPLKDSGIAWLGPVPAHWVCAKTSRYFKISMGQTILGEELIEDGAWPVFSATDGDHYFGRVNNPRVRLEVGDLVIPARGNCIGAVKLVKEPATTTQTTIYCKNLARNILLAVFVYYFLRGNKENLFYFTRTAIPQITVEEVGSNPILIPPLDEQRRIANFLAGESARYDTLTSEALDTITLLQERRTALISAAVTGKIDVRHWRAPEI